MKNGGPAFPVYPLIMGDEKRRLETDGMPIMGMSLAAMKKAKEAA